MNQDERRLLKLFRDLPSAQQAGLIDYAEFLASRSNLEASQTTSQVPLDIPRPAEENVIKAIKRLTATYPMLDKSRDKLLHETSGLMTQHLIHGRPAVEVIDELEAVFRRHYENYSNA